MAAYIIGEIEITDLAGYEAYRPLAAASIARHGGKYLVRGGAAETLDGAGPPKRIVALEFATFAAAKAFYNSPDYQDALKLRLMSSTGRVIVVDGV